MVIPSYVLTSPGLDSFIMKRILLAPLAFAAYVAACASYRNCHCYDANKVPNNNATEKVCGYHFGVLQKISTGSSDQIGYDECNSDVPEVWWNNCEWRRECAKAGATGQDSSCGQ